MKKAFITGVTCQDGSYLCDASSIGLHLKLVRVPSNVNRN